MIIHFVLNVLVDKDRAFCQTLVAEIVNVFRAGGSFGRRLKAVLFKDLQIVGECLHILIEVVAQLG
jgi:hypothetical protein